MGKDLKGKEIGKGINQRSDGTYHARYTDRFGKRRSLYDKDKAKLKLKLKEAQKQDAAGVTVQKKLYVRDWYQQWLKQYKSGIRRTSFEHYKGIADRYIMPVIGGHWLTEVKPIHCRDVINRMHKNGLGWESQDKARAIMADMFSRALENEYIVKLPTRGLKPVAEKPDPEKQCVTLTLDEQKQFLLTSAGTFYYNFYAFAMNSGLRPGEIFALTEGDINFDKKIISVTKTLHYSLENEGETHKKYWLGPPKTKYSEREVVLNDNAADAVRKQIELKRMLSSKYPNDGEFGDRLFVSSINTPLNVQTIKDAISRVVNEINMQRDELDYFRKFSAHTFRHTFATRCIEAGVQPKALQKILGHKDLKTTMDLYVSAFQEFQQDELSKFNDKFGEIFEEPEIEIGVNMG